MTIVPPGTNEANRALPHPDAGLSSTANVEVQRELGLSPDVGGAARGDALVVGLTYMGAAVIPLWPYIVLPLMAPALITSIVCTLIALFALGVAKGRIARQAWQRAGLQVMLIGSASAAVGFAIGHLVTAVTG
jgi:vacuolar iron transporter family protein